MFILSLVDSARHAVAGWHRKQQAYAELMALDDRSLADIGIRRSEIPAIVEGNHEAVQHPGESEFIPPFRQHQLAGSRTWFPWFPPL
jgi:uncharacterized protein YjiS (DUF1127 family)